MPVDDEWLTRTAEERIEAVWMLTQICHAWTQGALVNPDFRDLLAQFNANGVEYLVVGAHALATYGHVRATKDLDVSRHHLIANKKASGRLQDLADIEKLEEIERATRKR